MAQESLSEAKMGPRWPREPQIGPRWAQDGAKLGPRWGQDGSKIGLKGLLKKEAEKGPPQAFGALLGPIWASWGPLGLKFALIFGILS